VITGVNCRNWTPSNRTKPAGVATQRNPSGVCSVPITVLSGSPSSDCQTRMTQGKPSAAGGAATANTSSRLASQRHDSRNVERADTGAAYAGSPRGYRTALELAKRGIRAEDGDWASFITRGQLFFDVSPYEFDRQVKLSEYVNLRDEAFGSFRKAAEIPPQKGPAR
jgi:hypothetical protein